MSNLLGHPYDLLTKEQIARSVKVRAARVNALKSTGPRTPEGKAISACNAFKHGFAGAKLVLDEAEELAFDDHLDAYFLRFKPQDQVEADSVRRVAEAQWKMDTINSTENTIMSLEGGFQMCLADAKLDPEQVTLHHYRALALIEQSEGRALDLCHRYYISAAREYDRALKTFYRLRDERVNDGDAVAAPDAFASPDDAVAIDDAPTAASTFVGQESVVSPDPPLPSSVTSITTDTTNQQHLQPESPAQSPEKPNEPTAFPFAQRTHHPNEPASGPRNPVIRPKAA